jgi:hypothetical protein
MRTGPAAVVLRKEIRWPRARICDLLALLLETVLPLSARVKSLASRLHSRTSVLRPMAVRRCYSAMREL